MANFDQNKLNESSAKLVSCRAILRKVSFIFAGLTVIFWACALLEKKIQNQPWAIGAVYGVALLFIAFGFLTIFWVVRTRVAMKKNWVVTAVQALASFIFFSIGGPLVLAWLTLRAFKHSS